MQKQVQLTRIQKLIGKRMQQSKRDIPCFYLRRRADLTELADFRKGPCRKAGIRAGTNEFFFKAMAKAVEKFPLFAGQLQADQIEIADSVNIGFAVDTAQGLVVPVVKGCEKLSISEISNKTKELTNKARLNQLSVDELSGASITLSSLGMFGLTSFTAIVPPGQASILAIGRIIDQPTKTAAEMAIRKKMNLTLSVDHRIINGLYAAKFLKYVTELLEDPSGLVE